MNNENTRLCSEKFKGDISPKQADKLEEKLQSVSDERVKQIQETATKSVGKTVLLSAIFGLFGGGSFYLGQIKRGVCKVVFNVIVPFTLGMIFLFWLAPMYKNYGDQCQHYLDFSICKTESLSDFRYEYSLSGNTDTTSDDDNVLYDRGLTENISRAASVFNSALDLVKKGSTELTDTPIFEKAIYLVCSDTAGTLLQYYTDEQPDGQAESALLNYMEETPKGKADEELGITEALRKYYDLSRDIASKSSGDGLKNQTSLEKIGQNLNDMSAAIKDLNTRTKDKMFGWQTTSGILYALFSTLLGIDLTVIAVYWVFEVFRDREKCFDYNFNLICKAME